MFRKQLAIEKYQSLFPNDEKFYSNVSGWLFSRKILVLKELGVVNNQLEMLLKGLKDHRNAVHINFEMENKITYSSTFVNTLLNALKELCDYFLKEYITQKKVEAVTDTETSANEE